VGDLVLRGYQALVPDELYLSNFTGINTRKRYVSFLSRFSNPTADEVIGHIARTLIDPKPDYDEKGESQKHLEWMLSQLSGSLRLQLINQDGPNVETLRRLNPYSEGERLLIETAIVPSRYFKGGIQTSKELLDKIRELRGSSNYGWMFDILLFLEDGALPESHAIDLLMSDEEISGLATEKMRLDLWRRVVRQELSGITKAAYEALNPEAIQTLFDDTQGKLERASSCNLYGLLRHIASQGPKKIPEVNVPVVNRTLEKPDSRPSKKPHSSRNHIPPPSDN